MPSASLFAVLPAECAELCTTVTAAGATPIVDLSCVDSVSVPDGAWVRTRSIENVPGTGPVILIDGDTPVSGRETWLEVTSPKPTPSGFAGIVLRGGGVGR